MKKYFFALLIFGAITNAFAETPGSSSIYSQVDNKGKAEQFGVGISVGGTNGLSIQYWLDNERTVNGTFAADRYNSLISIAHLWLFHDSFSGSEGQANYFVPYLGVGAIGAFGSRSDYFRKDDEDSVVAAQLPLGIEFLPGPDRFDIYAEINPSIVISSNAGGFLTANLGARFYF